MSVQNAHTAHGASHKGSTHVYQRHGSTYGRMLPYPKILARMELQEKASKAIVGCASREAKLALLDECRAANLLLSAKRLEESL